MTLFDRFLTCLASEENPLTLFIDDLQWCDVASFDFLANIFANYQEHPYLFLLGAYPPQRGGLKPSPVQAHPERHGRAGQPLKEIRLGPLKPEHCHEMVSYILDAPSAADQGAVGFHQRTHRGQPALREREPRPICTTKTFSTWMTNGSGGGTWTRSGSPACRPPSSPFSARRFRSSRRTLIALLEYCACMGNTFSPDGAVGDPAR